jgi:hypothetical protein
MLVCLERLECHEMLTAAGIVIGLGAIALVLVALGRRGDSRDLGSVSRVWITEHRVTQRDDRG